MFAAIGLLFWKTCRCVRSPAVAPNGYAPAPTSLISARNAVLVKLIGSGMDLLSTPIKLSVTHCLLSKRGGDYYVSYLILSTIFINYRQFKNRITKLFRTVR